MGDFIGSVWWMIVSLGVLVTFHEFGHYWVARRCGVKVLRFSVGFGRPLWSRRNRDGTEFAIAAIPLGGYVKMLDEREGEVHPSERAQAFNHKTVWQRIAIVAAGPIANLLLCMLLLWAMFVIGKQDYSATVGRAEGLAAAATLRAGDRIVAVDGAAIDSFDQIPAQVQALGKLGVAGMIEVEREGDRLALEIRPTRGADGSWLLGVAPAASPAPPYDIRQQYGLFAAVPAAIRETGRMAGDSLGMMKRMLTGHASVKNISGPVTIARVANASAERGPDWFLYFL
ncbi:RIP metalloprotease RseP, partial [Xanthomonas sp. Kuri4-2]